MGIRDIFTASKPAVELTVDAACHADQEELTKQVLSAVKLTRGDGGWVMGRKQSGIVCGAVASAMVTHFEHAENLKWTFK